MKIVHNKWNGFFFSVRILVWLVTGMRSNFGIGGAPLVTQYWGGGGGAQDTFSH